MNKIRQIFHVISYLQYPIMLASLYFYCFFMISLINRQIEWDQLNSVLIFMGISLSFSTLQDPTKTQNKLSRKIWEHPIFGKTLLLAFSITALLFISLGLYGFLKGNSDAHKDVSYGLVVLGIGCIGMLKVAIEMFENHRLDKNTPEGEDE